MRFECKSGTYWIFHIFDSSSCTVIPTPKGRMGNVASCPADPQPKHPTVAPLTRIPFPTSDSGFGKSLPCIACAFNTKDQRSWREDAKAAHSLLAFLCNHLSKDGWICFQDTKLQLGRGRFCSPSCLMCTLGSCTNRNSLFAKCRYQ